MLGSPIRILFLIAATALLLPGAALAGGDVTKGKASYDMNCMSCHGPEAKGKGPLAAALTPAPRDLVAGDFKYDADKDGKTGSDADIAGVIKQGAAAFGGSPLMAPWPSLSDSDIENVVAYLRSLK